MEKVTNKLKFNEFKRQNTLKKLKSEESRACSAATEAARLKEDAQKISNYLEEQHEVQVCKNISMFLSQVLHLLAYHDRKYCHTH